ncbi:MAG: type I restriction endonuclease subunit R [Candidatus Cloacimonetes bacterium]|nr:type I restriction endonuclease subunit R [Candidatus Cloacimonadota bacterium]MDY0366768.1 type I restriction endonuclease subunit R [Candidatus Syntrophosphaera sp.]
MLEKSVESIALHLLEDLGYQIKSYPHLLEDSDIPELLRLETLQAMLARFNPTLPVDCLAEAAHQVLRLKQPSLLDRNRAFHKLLVEGVPVSYRLEGKTVHSSARLVDFAFPENNDFLAVSQMTVIEDKHIRRPDIVLFLNGLPLAVLELKNPSDPNTTIWSAYNQIQTYISQIPSLFAYNSLLVITDGLDARVGTLSSGRERMMPWRTISGEEIENSETSKMEVLLRGIFEPSRLISIIRHFIVFEENRSGTIKKLAGYHQFHAVNAAVDKTIQAISRQGDRRCGVVWHTQGSGKSLTMAFYAGRLVQHPALENPTIVVITDRNDLDDQLFRTFCSCRDLIRQTPKQADDRADLRNLLKVASGGVIFTTIQKFMPDEVGVDYPLLSERRNIVVIADEAHRSQYDFIDGFAKNMRDALPNASFIAFTGTPVELTDRNTRAVFGDYISVYDIQQAVLDNATVPIYYESRLAKLELDEAEKPKLDPEFEEITENREPDEKEKLKSKWAALEAVVGSQKRIDLIAADIVAHWETRSETLEGKAMIVCMSRRICVELYQALTKLRPGWHSPDDRAGAIKVVMTGNPADPLEFQGHIRSKDRRDKIAERFKDPADPLRIAIVRDMWLTGFDVPCLHTMYVDKPMHGHGLMQAIARVNRVYKDKPGGLVVDYLGLAEELKRALATYTQAKGKGTITLDQNEALAVLMEQYEQCQRLFHGFDWSAWLRGTPKDKLDLIAPAQEFILAQENGKTRLVETVAKLTKAFALSVPHPSALEIREEIGFFQSVKAAVIKSSGSGADHDPLGMESAIAQLVSKAISSDRVVDIFAAAGLEKPDVSILSDEFLEEVRRMPHKNLAVELLKKLLNDEIKARFRKNAVLSRSFAEMLAETIRKYQNRTLEAAAIIAELIKIAKEVKDAEKRGEKLKMNDDELAFYDALGNNDSAVLELGDETLKKIALELIDSVRRNVTIDWAVREQARAKMRVMVKRILKKYGYPPDKTEEATDLVIEQAELICGDFAA